MAVNVTAVFALSREVFPHLVAAGGGTIINIGSFFDKLGVRNSAAYCASKAGVAGLTRALAVEWAKRGIRVLDVAPGYVVTDLNARLPTNPKVRVKYRGDKPYISVTPHDPLPDPPNLEKLKRELNRRWPSTSLLDVLKETDLRVGFTEAFSTSGNREITDAGEVQRRLLLALYGLGTNAGLKRIVSGRHGVSYKELLHIRRRYIDKAAMHDAIRRVINAIMAARAPDIWGEGTTACASDSTKFGAWDQNLMTEWHARYGGRLSC